MPYRLYLRGTNIKGPIVLRRPRVGRDVAHVGVEYVSLDPKPKPVERPPRPFVKESKP